MASASTLRPLTGNCCASRASMVLLELRVGRIHDRRSRLHGDIGRCRPHMERQVRLHVGGGIDDQVVDGGGREAGQLRGHRVLPDLKRLGGVKPGLVGNHSWRKPVLCQVMVMLAPANAAPVWSVTVPRM